jgi:hypothetical protein
MGEFEYPTTNTTRYAKYAKPPNLWNTFSSDGNVFHRFGGFT